MSSNSARRSAVQAITTYKPEASPLNLKKDLIMNYR